MGDCSPVMRGKVIVTQAWRKLRKMMDRAGSERVSHSGILRILGMGVTFWWSRREIWKGECCGVVERNKFTYQLRRSALRGWGA